jgi:hypothetical protein
MISSLLDTVGKRRERWSLSDDSAPPSAPASPAPTPSPSLPPITLTIPRSYIDNAAKAPAASSSSCDVTDDFTGTRQPEAPSAKMAPDGVGAGTGTPSGSRPAVAGGDAAVAVAVVAATPSPVKSNSSPTKKFHCQICTRGKAASIFFPPFWVLVETLLVKSARLVSNWRN